MEKTAIRKPIPEEPLLLASASMIRFLVTITQNFSSEQAEPRATMIDDEIFLFSLILQMLCFCLSLHYISNNFKSTYKNNCTNSKINYLFTSMYSTLSLFLLIIMVKNKKWLCNDVLPQKQVVGYFRTCSKEKNISCIFIHCEYFQLLVSMAACINSFTSFKSFVSHSDSLVDVEYLL